MALNLSRNSRVFLTTKLNSSNQVDTTSHTASTTFEIQVLDGFTFSQNTNTETVTLTEAGSAPSRGQRSFNTSLAPVDFSFSTYVRPELATNVKAEESVLWGVLVGNALATNGGFNSASPSTSTITPENSNVNTLTKFGLIVVIDNVTYFIDNCAMNQAVVDFAIDQIATIQWSGFGTAIRQAGTSVAGTAGTFSAGVAGSYTAKNTTADFLTNKLSTATINTGSGSISVGGGTALTVPITGGSLTYNNNITYLTPSNLAVVNAPITYFTGTRSITGTLSAYLRTGTSTGVGNDTGAFLKLMLDNVDKTETNFSVVVNIGGIAAPYVKADMPTCSIQIPNVDVQQVVSTTINFTAQGYNAGYDLGAKNELTLSYFAV